MPRPQNLPTSFLVFAAALAVFVAAVALVDHRSGRPAVERPRAETDDAGLAEAMTFVPLREARP